MVRENDIYQHFSQEGLKDPRHKRTYERIFDALGHPPENTFSGDFAKKVLRKIEALEKGRKRWFYTGMISGVMVMLGTFTWALVYGLGWEQLSHYQNYIYWTALISVSVVVIQYLDQSLVRRKSMTRLT